MRAAVLTEFGQPFEFWQIDQRGPLAGEVRVRIMACAICHSDIHFADGAWGGECPMVLGHEASGEIVEVGDGVEDLAVGDRVAVTLVRHCGDCPCCSKGYVASCETHLRDRYTPLSHNGAPVEHGLMTAAFAEETVVHASQVVRVGDKIPWDAAALLACGVITGYGAATHSARIEPGATVAVVGCGGVGLNAVQGAVACGAAQIVAVDLAEDRLAAAMAFGATDRVNASQDDAIKGVKGATGRRGADYVLITVGSEKAIEQGFRMAAPGGVIVVVGMPSAKARAEFSPMMFSTLSQRVIGSLMGHMPIKEEIPKLVSLYEDGQLKLDELVSRHYLFDELNAAMDATRRGEGLRNVVMIGAA
ncbi:MAG: zinc-binding dehydrogenase [Pseudomonadota bacterium]